ncbi:MAG: hypothetical protein HRU20_21150 [Pseudomonadales bacterium]|nr:hypothetical protein [Pseudomonadales bacterium]
MPYENHADFLHTQGTEFGAIDPFLMVAITAIFPANNVSLPFNLNSIK